MLRRLSVAALVVVALCAVAMATLTPQAQIDIEQLQREGRWLMRAQDMPAELAKQLAAAGAPTGRRTADAAAGRERRDASPVTFTEFNFQGDVTFSWNDRKTDYVLAVVENLPYLSKNGGKTFLPLSATLTSFNDVQGPRYGHPGGHGVRATYINPSNANQIILQSYGEFFWMTLNGGDSWTKIPTPGLFLFDYEFHPRNENLILALHIDAGCFSASVPTTKVCSQELMLTTNYGADWKRLSTHVVQFVWGYSERSVREDDTVYYLAQLDRTRPQFVYDAATGLLNFGATANLQHDLIVFDIGDNERTLALHDAVTILVWGDYVFAITRDYNSANQAVYSLQVSFAGYPFRRSTLKDVASSVFSIVDVYDGGVVLVQVSALPGSRYMDATVWTSGGDGYQYSRSLTGLLVYNTPYFTLVDMSKMEAFGATYIATQIFDYNTEVLRSVITWNRGAQWTPVVTYDGIDGTINEGLYPLTLFGLLNIGVTGDHLGIASEPSAPGIILALGAHNVTFGQYALSPSAVGDVFYSRNGGATFKRVLNGAHMCAILDEGVVIVCVPSDEPTRTLRYSFSGGDSWTNIEFSSRPVDVIALHTDPDNVGLRAIIEASDPEDSTLIGSTFFAFTLADLSLRQCTDQDRETWTPTDGRPGERCLMGRHVSYVRVRKGSECHSNTDAAISIGENCTCSAADFECAYNYTLSADTSRCVPEKGVTIAQPPCEGDKYYPPTGYRRIPGNTCDRTKPGAEDYETPYAVPCPSKNELDSVTRQRNIAIGVGVTVGVLALAIIIAGIIYARRFRYRRYRHLALNEIAVGTSDDDAYLFDDDDADPIDPEDTSSHSAPRSTATATTATATATAAAGHSIAIGTDDDDDNNPFSADVKGSH